MRINIDVSMPIYQQIIDEIKRAVARGDLKPGDKLPSHRDMAKEIQVNPNTVQRAYREMEQEKLVATLRGQGTFISDDSMLIDRIRREMADNSVSAFVQEMMALGLIPEKIISLVAERIGGLPADLPGDLPDDLPGGPFGGVTGASPGSTPGGQPDCADQPVGSGSNE